MKSKHVDVVEPLKNMESKILLTGTLEYISLS